MALADYMKALADVYGMEAVARFVELALIDVQEQIDAEE